MDCDDLIELQGLIGCYEYAYFGNDFFEMGAIKREICYLLQIPF